MKNSPEILPRTIMWRRIDQEGMDACAIGCSAEGYEIMGTALFLAENGPSRLEYRVACDEEWRSRAARINGWVGADKISLEISQSPDGSWAVDGKQIAGVDGLLDVDLGFTPATNTNAIRRLRLEVGATAATTAVWLDVQDWTFKPLQQIYRRRSKSVFAYSSPSHDYEADLVVDEFGLIKVYPHLWEAM